MKKLILLGAGKLLEIVYKKTNWDKIGVKITKLYLSNVNIDFDKKTFVKLKAPLSNFKINSVNFLKEIEKIKPDLILCIGLREILKKNFIKNKNIKFINLHGAVLPDQRGPGGDYGAIINDGFYGMSTHYIEKEIDTGNIILTKKWRLNKNSNKSELIKTAHSKVNKLIEQTLIKVMKNKNGTRQKKYAYYPRKPAWDEYINWSENSDLINKKIKARDPYPLNFTIYRDKILFIKECEIISKVKNYIAPCGQIIGKTNKGVLVKTGDNAILITKVALMNNVNLDKRDKYPYQLPRKFFIPKFNVNEMLGYNIFKEIFLLKKEIIKLKKNVK